MDHTSTTTGSLTLDHRLRRLADTLHDQANATMRELGLDFDHGWTPVYRALHENGPATLDELATFLDWDHPTLLHITRPMSEAGLLQVNRNRLEGHTRQWELTDKAVAMAADLQAFWSQLDETQQHLFRAAQCEIKSLLERVERGLVGEPVRERILRAMDDNVTTA